MQKSCELLEGRLGGLVYVQRLDSGSHCGGSRGTESLAVDRLHETSRRELQDYAKNGAGPDTMSGQAVTLQRQKN